MRATRLLAAGSLCATLALTGCGDDETDTAAEASPEASPSQAAAAAAETSGELGCDDLQGAVVGYSQPLPDPNFEAISAVIEKALGEYGATLRPVNANLDPGKQVSDINTLLDQGINALIANPIDPNATQPAFDRVRGADIPIIAQETTRGGPFATNVTADVEAAAREGAELLREAVGEGAVTALNGPDFAEVIVRENTTFAETAEQIGLNVADTQVNQEIRPEAAKAIADAWRTQYGADLKGVWTFNDISAVGVASSVGGDFEPVIVSINGNPPAIPLIESGRILATFDLQQEKLGQALAYAAINAICGEELPETIVVPVKKIDASNVSEWRPLEERLDAPFDVQLEERDGVTYVAD